VFASLRSAGLRIDREAAVDFVHEFIIERAPGALATFCPERGELKGWLFVVFRRFVLGTLRERTRQARLIRAVAEHATSHPVEHELAFDVDAARRAIAELPSEQRRAVRVFLETPDGSIRETARRLGVSRWRASQYVSQALEFLAARLGFPNDDLPPSAISGLRHLIENQHSRGAPL
jgi:RNA polymerase sigma factor (sigma-70 family)